MPLPLSRRACELLAWLALNPGEHPRGILAATFWPDVLDTSARASLRSAAWSARKALGPAGDALTATRDRVGLRCTTDLQSFDELVEQDRLDEAVALCRGPLLADLDEDWILEARDRHAQRLGAVLTRLADAAPTPQAAVELARRRLALDALDEDAARELMRRLAAAGDRSGALAVYDRLSERLRAHLGLAPSPPTRALSAELRAPPPEAEPRPAAAPPPPAPPAPLPPAPPAPPLVGRDAELAELLRATTPGARAVAVVTGEAGIGKTRLASELLAEAAAAGVRTASCTALELGGPAPFQLWAELLRDLARTIPAPPRDARWPEELAALAPSLPMRLGRTAAAPAAVAPELARARLFEAVVDCLEHACADRPLILLFEDVHASDPPSLELLSYTSRRFDRLPIAAVLTRRQVPARADLDALLHAHRARGGTVTEIALPPLRRTDVDALIRQVAALDAPARDRVAGAADGNPLLAVESARAAATGLRGPAPTLQGVVAAALGPLPPSARRIAELVAVAGRPLKHAELDALSPQPADALAALESGLFATDRAGFGFRHQLLLDAALAQLAEPRARELHGELAAVIAGPAAEVARHLKAAGQDDAAADRLAHAASEALRVGAVAQAIAFLQEALELRPGDPALLLDLAQAYAYNGLRTEAEEALDRALRRFDPADHAARGAAHLRAARWYSGVLCWPRRTVEEANRALAELDRVPETAVRTIAEALALGAWAEAAAGDPARAETLLARFAALDVDDPDVRYENANARACQAMRQGRLEEAMDHFAECIAAGGGSPDSVYAAWSNRAALAAALGRTEEALDHAEHGLDAVHELGDLPPLVGPLHALRATLLARIGRFDEARTAIAAEREAAERSSAPALLALADHDEGMLCAAARQDARAAELLARALDHDAAVSRPLARLARAEALARLGRADDAERELRAVTLEPVRAVDRPPVLVARLSHVQGLIALARDDIDLAARRFEESAAAWRRLPTAGGGELLANLVDLGRPTLGPVEPARELQRVTDELSRLAPLPT
ncbi:AAA family ATPase [Capillimicrobium parvum]|uniref:AAA family ATPase n=1 Tax=Capillimicrobium parvum TaxID=2884022 RepID=UPI00216AD3D7|nr:AAA family ATPase [Capillimicrobium parvum]